MGNCECGLKGNPCGPLRPNTINVTMPKQEPFSLYPLGPKEALRAFMQVDPEKVKERERREKNEKR